MGKLQVKVTCAPDPGDAPGHPDGPGMPAPIKTANAGASTVALAPDVADHLPQHLPDGLPGRTPTLVDAGIRGLPTDGVEIVSQVADTMAAGQSIGQAQDDEDIYEDFENRHREGQVSSRMSVAFADPIRTVVRPLLGRRGRTWSTRIRSECGFILQGIDWAARKLGYDLIGAIMDPIAGDFSAVDGMRQDWHVAVRRPDPLGDNYREMADEPVQRSGPDRRPTAAQARLARMAKGHGTQAEAAQLMSMQMNNMLTAVKEACKLVANVLGLLEELLLSFSHRQVGQGGAHDGCRGPPGHHPDRQGHHLHQEPQQRDPADPQGRRHHGRHVPGPQHGLHAARCRSTSTGTRATTSTTRPRPGSGPSREWGRI